MAVDRNVHTNIPTTQWVVLALYLANTQKLLHIGVRNRLCYICSQAQTKNVEPPIHECYKNWEQNSQSLESDIMLEGFLAAESKHGVRYMRLIGGEDNFIFS